MDASTTCTICDCQASAPQITTIPLCPACAKSLSASKCCDPKSDLTAVEDGLFLSGRQVASQPELLAVHGITHIVSVLPGGVEMPSVKNCLRIKVQDLPTEDLASHFEDVFRFISSISAEKHEAVLVHCGAGVSRSAALVVAYLMRKHGWKLGKTYEFLRGKRPAVCPNSGFLLQLRKYEAVCLASVSKS